MIKIKAYVYCSICTEDFVCGDDGRHSLNYMDVGEKIMSKGWYYGPLGFIVLCPACVQKRAALLSL